jgi:hypothetical protein
MLYAKVYVHKVVYEGKIYHVEWEFSELPETGTVVCFISNGKISSKIEVDISLINYIGVIDSGLV